MRSSTTGTWGAARRAGVATLGVALLLGAGCSASIQVGGYDAADLEDQLVEEQKEASPDLEVGAAVCPEDIDDVEEGDSFECTVEIEGTEAPYTVTLTDEDEGTLDFKPAKAIIDVSKIVEFLRGNLNTQFADADVECGDEAVLVTEVGDTIDCTVSDETGSETVPMVVKNIDGDIGFK